ncbi:hypothetical protein B0O41_4147 [Propionibacteriaceae bacterium ES.041]|uniref:amidohydrolase family protein n=1 Tax=Enemella evansiae TaxID=2016499 RepID=UPI000B9796AD|nr:amidohydrolase family protein [Enemella evansiae]OYO02962.1 4-hydroxyphenyl-beta-ketoacyl-CoA hydrolase [Enemella evansiae]OYO14187.1 4-hydroxyphenyl-beta-ketoacyl-CoA hydrolase [Enemella evansiae]PFG69293.1 hypothetical protein B0O41_4147 [Propionibacteriaceae bacterium ES.041]TDO91918.1 hypothetical protein C8D81_2234 [Enemella evansiae]
MSYAPELDLANLKAIDIHTHVEIDSTGHRSVDDELMDASAAYFKATDTRTPTIEQIADYYRQRSMAAVVFTVDATTALGRPPNSVTELAERAADHPDVLIPFGSVDPWAPDAVERVGLLVEQYGVRGFKFHPGVQAFRPNEERFAPIYAAIAAAGVPALFHTGQTGIGAGLPGGRGIKLHYSDPLLLDDVAADFPDLTLIMAHPAVPWVDVQISIATHKPNAFIDLSGWSPKYFPPQLVRAANSLLQDKVLFGTDFPLISPDRWLADAERLDFKPEVLPKLLKDNALRVLGLRQEG